MTLFKSSRSQVFYKIGIFKNFTIFTAKHEHLCWNLFLIKLQLWRPATWLKENFNIGIFLRNFKSSFFIEHLWCLFLINGCEHLLFWISNQQACLIIEMMKFSSLLQGCWTQFPRSQSVHNLNSFIKFRHYLMNYLVTRNISNIRQRIFLWNPVSYV